MVSVYINGILGQYASGSRVSFAGVVFTEALLHRGMNAPVSVIKPAKAGLRGAVAHSIM